MNKPITDMDIYTWDYLPNYLYPTGKQKFATISKNPDVTMPMQSLIIALATVPQKVLTANQLADIGNPIIDKTKTSLTWIVGLMPTPSYIYRYGCGHMSFIYDSITKTIDISILYNTNPGAEWSARTNAIGFTSQKDALNYVRRGNTWAIPLYQNIITNAIKQRKTVETERTHTINTLLNQMP